MSVGEHQLQLKGVRKREILCVDARCYRLVANESEMRRHCRIDHHISNDELLTGKLLCPVDGCYNNYVKKEWSRN